MKLGDLVTFNTDYVKTGNNFDPEWIEDIAPKEVIDDMYDNGYELIKLKPRRHEKPKEGIVVGKRYYSMSTHFEYMEDFSSDWKWASETQPKEPFYLVACHLNALYKVAIKDLKAAEKPIAFIEDAIEGLIDE